MGVELEKVDFAMTSVLRPNLFDGTLKTIQKGILRHHIDDINFKLILNIDPVGEKVDPMEMVEITKKYFENVIYRIAKTPSFPKAVKWVWSKTDAPYVFHWEDDVNLLRQVDVMNMIEILKKYPELSSLRLYKAGIPKRDLIRTFGSIWKYHPEGFYLANDWKRQFGLNPILIKKAFVKEAVERMVVNFNPEKQFREAQKYMRPLIKKWKYGIYAKPGDRRIIDGRKGKWWKDELKLKKPKGKTFVQWVGGKK